MILIAILLWIFVFYLLIHDGTGINNWILKFCISLLLVISITTFLYFFIIIAGISFLVFQIWFLVLPAILLSAYHLLINKQGLRKIISIKYSATFSDIYLIIVFSCLIIFTVLFYNESLRWGRWDAWAIWTLHAKFLFDKEAFTIMMNYVDVPHPDYPLMLSSLIAIIWKSSYSQTPIVPLIIAYLTSLTLVIINYVSFVEKSRADKAILILAILCCTNIIYLNGSSQYSDTLLALFFLIPFVLIDHLPENGNKLLSFLIGFFVASSGWIKNEGLVFILVFSIFYIIKFLKKRAISGYLAGTALPVLVILVFKVFYAPVNDLFQLQTNDSYTKLFDYERHFTVIQYFISYLILNFPLVLIILIAALLRFKFYRTFGFRVIISMILVYYLGYIMTPRELIWHLDTSFARLMHHIFPALIYTIFQAADFRKPELSILKVNSSSLK